MKSRLELVGALIEQPSATSAIMLDLKKYEWDSENELVTLKPHHIIQCLSLYISGEITSEQVQDWANAIEGRDDIGLHESDKTTLDEMIFWLANPYLNYPITLELASLVIQNLESNKIKIP